MSVSPTTPTHKYLRPSVPEFRYNMNGEFWRNPDTLTEAELYHEVMHCGLPLLEILELVARAFQTGNPLAALAKAIGVAACDAPSVSVHTGLGSRPVPLNFMVCLVGVSGMGKGMTLDMPLVTHHPLGGYRVASPASGEALVNAFFDKVPAADGRGTDTVRHSEPVWATWNEIDAFAAKSGNVSSTLDATLRSLFTGENVGDTSISREKAGFGCTLEGGSYRFVMFVGAQPDHAGSLLEDQTGGTLQRMLWFPLIDKDALQVDVDSPEDEPDEIDLAKAKLERLLGVPKGSLEDSSAPNVVVWGPTNGAVLGAGVKKILKAQRSTQLRGSGTASLDSHENNLRTRLAAIFASWRAGAGYQMPVTIDREAWYWAGCVTALSRLQYQSVVKAADDAEEKDLGDKGKRAAVQKIAQEAEIARRLEKNVDSCKERILEIAAAVIGMPEWCKTVRPDPTKPASVTEIYRGLSPEQRKHRKAAMEALIGDGKLTEVEDGRSTRFAITSETSAETFFTSVTGGAA